MRTVEDGGITHHESLRIYGFAQSAVERTSNRIVEETDWLAEWKKHWKPTSIGKFIIAPPWADVDATDEIVVRIEPNMAFGTGTHETTQLCLQAIDEHYPGGETFFDVGTGTGILAIAAARIQSESKKAKVKILAADIDADSVKIARENAIANGVGEMIEFVHGTITDDMPAFDFVCANLTADVILPILPLLMAKARKTLVLSGILAEQKDIIATELQNLRISNCKSEISDFRFQIKGEWVAFLVEKTS